MLIYKLIDEDSGTLKLSEIKIAIIGLGYVGLPLALEFGKKFSVVGYDHNNQRIKELLNGIDITNETNTEEIKKSKNLTFSNALNDIEDCNCYIVTVPTPIDERNMPDLSPLFKATEMIGGMLNKGNVIIYESTVYPGVTEDECVPILEKVSGLTFNKEFFCGYSPERINPGDKEHRLTNIKKVTSGSTPEVALFVDNLYNNIIDAGTHMSSSIRVAEAAKVIENTQRDLNIALINELALIFNEMNIDTEEVLKAAGSKWNFLPFRPGLVGGHCIGVDPYYLTYKAQMIGYDPQIILAGRRLNDEMGSYVAEKLITTMEDKGIFFKGAKVLIMGFTFKENCPDIRNTRVIDIYNNLILKECNVEIYDPHINPNDTFLEYGIEVSSELKPNKYSAVILAVAHKEFSEMGPAKIRSLCLNDGLIYDLKYILNKDESDIRL